MYASPVIQPALPAFAIESLCSDLSDDLPAEFELVQDRLEVSIVISDGSGSLGFIDMSKSYWSQEPVRGHDEWVEVLTEMFEDEEYEPYDDFDGDY